MFDVNNAIKGMIKQPSLKGEPKEVSAFREDVKTYRAQKKRYKYCPACSSSNIKEMKHKDYYEYECFNCGYKWNNK